jgi:hypothetical protein
VVCSPGKAGGSFIAPRDLEGWQSQQVVTQQAAGAVSAIKDLHEAVVNQ